MDLNGKNILVTGASGLIGSNLIQRFKSLNVNVKITMHNNLLGSFYAFETIRGDLTDSNFCDAVTQDIDIVFHCAADSSGAATHDKNPLSMFKNNIIMNVNLLDSAYKNNVKKFIWFASTTGYPESYVPVVEEDMFIGDPYDKYFAVGWMKRYTEKLCQMYATKVTNPMTCIILRPSNIYGPNDKTDPKRSHVLAALIRKVIEKQNPIQIWGDGTEIRDVLYVDDMVDAIMISTEKVDGFEQFNIGYGESFSLIQLLDIIKTVTNYDAPNEFVAGPRMILTRRVNIEKAKKILGWIPKTNINDGIRKTYDWMKEKLK
jgi:GDP-L-fucose synthase